MPYAALRELLALTKLPYPPDNKLEISGADPVVRTPYKVGTAAAAVQAAIAVAVSELWKLQTGRAQQIRIDLRAAAIAMQGRTHTFLNGATLREEDTDGAVPRSIFYPVRDGRWIRIQTGYPHFRDITLETLGWPTNVEAAKMATAAWDGLELENRLHAAGGCAGLVRTTEEWARHPQSAAVASLPLLEIERIGDAPPEPLPVRPRPLSGIRVLDLTRVVAGPACARTLAEHGADVLKINGAHLPDHGIGELDSGIGKLSAFLDLRTTEGVETLRTLAREADVFSQGYRPGSLAARGFSPEELAGLRPGIIYVELSAWGKTGPWNGRRGYDPIVQAAAGISLTQGGGARPATFPVSAMDYVTGYLMALGVITALERRAREGGSWIVRASLARTGQWFADLGLLEGVDYATVPQPAAEEIARLSGETDSPLGRIRHLKPVIEFSETRAYWARPPVALGHHPPVWPARV
jgi:crotonobetainyl-CoA:carnitine CoA-transferase CaiB-like acyl-CoA transferase